MKFPRRKNDIVALTLEVLNGISANASDFPDPYHPGRIFVPSSGNGLFVALPAGKK